MIRTLYAKLALALLAVLAVVGSLYVLLSVWATESYLKEVRQKLHRSLAAHLVEEGLLLDSGDVDPEALEHVIHMLMVVNPGIEVYVLDPEGRVLAWSTPPGQLRRERVSLGPIQRFLSEDARLPLLGDDPRNPTGRKVFSVAPIGDPERPDGWVYVVLGGQLHDSVVKRLLASYVLKMGAGAAAAVLVFAFVTGLLLFWLTTRRLRRLARRVKAFAASGFTSKVALGEPTAGRGDEIDRLGDTFESMAERIRAQLSDLERADRLRRELVANVSHDLRTPLAALQGYLETVMLKGERLDPPERQRFLETATRNAVQLGRRIADLFELAKLDACAIRPTREPFQLAELVQDVVQKFELTAERRRVSLRTDRERGLPLIEADIGLVERVLENLLGNAIRHTRRDGNVTVSVEGKGASVCVRVRDTGPGIPAEELPSVFARFYRCRTGESEAETGAGLGLAIAKRIVDLHQGTIDVRSRVGEGTEFIVCMPAASSQGPPSGS